MDPATLATTIVGLLSPYLRQFGEKVAGALTERVAGQAADAAHRMVARLYRVLKAHVDPSSYEAAQLEGLEAIPDSPARQQALAGVLTEYLARHLDLMPELQELVVAARKAGAQVQAIGSGITAGGDVILHAGGDIVGRDRVVVDHAIQSDTSSPAVDS
jgi:hypothetical protein